MTTTEGGPGRSEASTGQREAARAHLTRLRHDGGTYRSIAAAAALSPGAVHRLASGRRRAQPGTATAVLTVTSPALTQARLDAGGTRLRLRALHVMGHGSARIARATGVHPVTIRKLVRGDAPTVSQHLRDAIADLYDTWWDKRAPGRTRAERAAATAARKRAMTGNWCAAAALDDDRLDIPGYRPRVRLETRHRHRRRPRHPPYCRPPQEEPRMTSEDRFTWGLILDVLDVLERHGYHKYDNQHTGRAVGVIFDLAHVYEGARETHPGPVGALATSRASTARPRSRSGRLVLTPADVSTVFAAADIAADDKRYRVEMCPDCPDQSCPDCQTHLRDAEAFDQMADRMLQAAKTAPAAHHGHTEPPRQSGLAADKEAGQ